MNAHHEWWNSSIQTPKRSDELVQILDENNYWLVNEPDTPTYFYRTGKGTSIIDLTFASPGLADEVRNWCLDPDAETGSDHGTIRYELVSTSSLLTTPLAPKYNWRKADWDKFTSLLTSTSAATYSVWHQLHQNPSPINLDNSAQLLRDLILEAVEASVPHINLSPRSKRWWHQGLRSSRTSMNNARKLWKRSRLDIDHQTFKKLRNQYFREIRKAKEETWKDFLKNAKGKDIFTALRFSKQHKTERTPTINYDNHSVNTFEEKASIFRKAMFPPPPIAHPQPFQIPPKPLPWKTFTPSEIQKAIFTSAPNKAPGPDGLQFLYLRHAYRAIPTYFNDLFSTLGSVGYHPKCWRQATTVIIPKNNKPDYCNPKAYRPIALLNCLGKVLEKLMASRLSYMSEVHDLLHHDQIGGRPQRSAIDAAMALAHEVETGHHNGEVTSVLLMDVRGAFDNVSKTRLLMTMRRLAIPSAILSWTETFLSDRLTSLSFDGQKDSLQPICTGIPQGSPASPILFLLYIRPLFDDLNNKQPTIWTPSYIDDVALVTKGPSKAFNARKLEAAARIAFQWANNNAVLFDDTKTEALHFHRHRNGDISDDETITLPNQTIITPGTSGGNPEAVRWIGIWFDRKLNFRHHVKLKTASGKRALGVLMRLANTESGLSPPAMRQLYLACVVPITDFGAEVWWKEQKIYSDQLQTIQNIALRKILGAFRTTPTSAMHIEAAIPPVHIRLTHLQRKYAIRILTMPMSHPVRQRCPLSFPPALYAMIGPDEGSEKWIEWDTLNVERKPYQSRLVKCLSTLSPWISNASDIESSSIDEAPPWTETSVKIMISDNSKDDTAKAHTQQVARLLADKKNIIAYSDGSMCQDKVGTGAVIYIPGLPAIELSIPMGCQVEVYDAELLGIKIAANKALHTIKSNGWKRKNVWIFVDNQAAIRRVTSLHHGPGQEIAIEIANISNQLKTLHCDLLIQWVPGHTSIPGNEKADELAKHATEQQPPREYQTSLSYLKRVVRGKMIEEWKDWWHKHPNKGSEYSSPFLSKPNVLFKTGNRMLVATAVQLRTSHGYFKSYLHKISENNTVTPYCSCPRGFLQNPRHLLLHCSNYKYQREQLRNLLHHKNPKLNLQSLPYSDTCSYGLEYFLKSTMIATRQWNLGNTTPSQIPPSNSTRQSRSWGTLHEIEDEHEERGE